MTTDIETRFADVLAMVPSHLAEAIESDPKMAWLASELRRRISARLVDIYEDNFGEDNSVREYANMLLEKNGKSEKAYEALAELQARADIVTHCRRNVVHLVFLFADRPAVRLSRRIRRFASGLGLCKPQSSHDHAIAQTYFKLAAAGYAIEGLYSQITKSFSKFCNHYFAALYSVHGWDAVLQTDIFPGYDAAHQEFRDMLREALNSAPEVSA